MSSADQREGIGAPTYWLHTWPRQYGLALVAVVVATLLRDPLSSVLGRSLSFLLFYPTIWLVAWVARLWPGRHCRRSVGSVSQVFPVGAREFACVGTPHQCQRVVSVLHRGRSHEQPDRHVPATSEEVTGI